MSHPNHTKDPRWRSPHEYPQAQLAAGSRRWLLDEGSLTARLVALTGGDFQVQRLHQAWQVPLASEQRELGLKPRQVALVREVALLCHGQAWVFARSVLPFATLTGPLRRLRQLANQSLGELLFQQPQLTRKPFQLAYLGAHDPYIHPHFQQAAPAWARRSRFAAGGRLVLVSEVFLEAFQPWPVLPR